MRGWVWWTVVALSGFVACGGSSIRKTATGDDDGSSDDGSSGSAGVSVATGGAPRGGAPNATGGRGSTTGGRGGSVGTGGAPNTGGSSGQGAVSGDGGTSGDAGAGAGGAPSCELAGGTTCTFAETCAVLGCGTAWSRYDENRCVRTTCAHTGLCQAGERCVVAPVGGRFDDPCGNESDSCDVTASGCECQRYEECFPSAVCLSNDEFPPERDCPIATLDCAELERALATLEAYLDGGSDVFLEPYEAPGNVAADLDDCFGAVLQRYENECS